MFTNFDFIMFNCNTRYYLQLCRAFCLCPSYIEVFILRFNVKIYIYLFFRFKNDVEVCLFMLEFFRSTIASVASMEAALIEVFYLFYLFYLFIIYLSYKCRLNQTTLFQVSLRRKHVKYT